MKADLWIDQYGRQYRAKNRKELKSQIPGRVSKMYRDTADGSSKHVGYVIGNQWLAAFKRVEL